jgi:hypothetical protein
MKFGLDSTIMVDIDGDDSGGDDTWELEEDLGSNNKAEVFAKLTARVAALETANKKVQDRQKDGALLSFFTTREQYLMAPEWKTTQQVTKAIIHLKLEQFRQTWYH